MLGNTQHFPRWWFIFVLSTIQTINCFILAHGRGNRASFERDLLRKPIFGSFSGEKIEIIGDSQKPEIFRILNDYSVLYLLVKYDDEERNWVRVTIF